MPVAYPEFLAVASVGKPHGVKGFFRVRSYSGGFEHFSSFDHVVLKNRSFERSYRVLELKGISRSSSALLRLEGVENPETARGLSGSEIWVPRENAAPKEDDEYYHADLCRCSLFFREERIGAVTAVLDGGNGPLLEISREEDGLDDAPGASPKTKKKNHRIFIPFRKEFIGRIRPEENYIELKELWILS